MLQPNPIDRLSFSIADKERYKRKNDNNRNILFILIRFIKKGIKTTQPELKQNNLTDNPTNRTKFYLKLRNALFGESETSNWQSLMDVGGINEDMARKLYENGIEDIGVLAMTTDEELQVLRFDLQHLRDFQKEARRILWAQRTGSIRFLKGIDQSTYDILTTKGVHLITQILELTAPSEGIDPSKWDKMVTDAKWIMRARKESQ